MAIIEINGAKIYFTRVVDFSRKRKLDVNLIASRPDNDPEKGTPGYLRKVHDELTSTDMSKFVAYDPEKDFDFVLNQKINGAILQDDYDRVGMILIDAIDLTSRLMYRHTPYDPTVITVEEFKESRDHINALLNQIRTFVYFNGKADVMRAATMINRVIDRAGVIAELLRTDRSRYYDYFAKIFNGSIHMLIGIGIDPIDGYIDGAINELEQLHNIPYITRQSNNEPIGARDQTADPDD